MGIKRFFVWLTEKYSQNIYNIRHGQNFDHLSEVLPLDNLLIDMNGIFHNSAQKVYEYGSFKPLPRLLATGRRRPQDFSKKQRELFNHIASTVEELVEVSKPRKRVILCVDGPAPLSKQYQQRQRRFRAAAESDDSCEFNSNCITPGTKFMDHLSKYLDWFIRKKVSNDPVWQSLEIIFSNEKAPGEGEHKCLNYMRFYGVKSETFCIHGLDADLIMLSLATHLPKFYLLREDLYNPQNKYLCVDIGKLRQSLIETLQWKKSKTPSKYTFNERDCINDFVFMCFAVGNDFLPHIPSIEIIENGLELVIKIYRTIGAKYGHLTKTVGERVSFRPTPLKALMGTIGLHEKTVIEAKVARKHDFFEDPITEECTNEDGSVDIEKYRHLYFENSFPDHSEEVIVHDYLEGLQWVLSYYTKGTPSWEWCFAHNYAPMASSIEKHISTYTQPVYTQTYPYPPFLQLLSVLPPKSANLLPPPLDKLLSDPKSPLKKFCPDEIEIDLSGKFREWEGIVLIPLIDRKILKPLYEAEVRKVVDREASRNIRGRTFKYTYDPDKTVVFRSYYGEIVSHVRIQAIDI